MRLALLAWLREAHPDIHADRLWSEFSVSLGASRVDVCLVNGSMTGYEIKSPRDNFGRLGNQIDHYSRILDFAYLVVAGKDVARALCAIPDWWGVLSVEEHEATGLVRLERQSAGNPAVDLDFVAQLLWRDEAFDELVSRGLARGLSKSTRWDLWDSLTTNLSPDELRAAVRNRLKARPQRATDSQYVRGGAR